jgi:hypothetical protein
MFGRRDGDASPRRFWNWFASEAQGLTNALEALSRGEADAEWAFAGLNDRITRFDSTLQADVIRTLDGECQLTVSGAEAAVNALLDAAPVLRGWRISSSIDSADRRRVPFRLAPRPSLDRLNQPLSGLHEAWA